MARFEPTYLSGYRILWMLVMFDLPTETKAERKAATKFREFLLNRGFERCQYSVYARFVGGQEGFAAKARAIEDSLPARGDILILHFTDRQYELAIHHTCGARCNAQKIPGQLALF